MSLIKVLYGVLGTISLIIGIIGIVVPGLPTTPFLLLTAWLFFKSSDRLYQKLINNKFVGYYIVDYQKKRGLTMRTRLSSIGIMWVMITISTTLFINQYSIKVIVLVVGIIGTIIMGFIIPKASDENINK